MLHGHDSDMSDLDKFNYNVWSIAKRSVKGVCTAATAPPCKQSAVVKCV